MHYLKISLVSFLFILAACSSELDLGPESSVAKDLLAQAKQAHEKADFKREVELYTKIVELDKREETILEYAEALRASGNYTKSNEIYQDILSKNPASIGAMEGKALSLLSEGDFNDATTLLNEVVKRDATRWKSINAMGIIVALSGYPDQARDYFNTALMITDNNPVILNNLALALAFNGKYEEASDKLKQAIAVISPENPNYKRAEMNLSLIYGVMGRTTDSKDILEKYLPAEIADKNLTFYKMLAVNEKEAKEYLRKMLSGEKNADKQKAEEKPSAKKKSSKKAKKKKVPASIEYKLKHEQQIKQPPSEPFNTN